MAPTSLNIVTVPPAGQTDAGVDGPRSFSLTVPVDLDTQSRQALEFDVLLEAVAGHAATPQGRRRLLGLGPRSDLPALQRELATLGETIRFLQTEGRLLSGGVGDPSATLAALAVQGVRIEARALRELAAALSAAADLGRTLRRLDERHFPGLRSAGATIPDLDAAVSPVLRHVDSEGTIADDASPELAAIRAEIRRLSGRLRRSLEARLQAPDSASVIRDDFVTQRNGRFVIPVRTDAPRRLQGIVHASSSSGATLFIEPLETVALNNELVASQEEEQQEQDRLLRDWSARFGLLRDEIEAALEGITSVDSQQARALFAEAQGGVVPGVGEGPSLRLVRVRHPLLDLRLRAQGSQCVPLDVELGPDDRVLVLSGPNTGGKTVALKTLGLAVLSAHSGLPVVAAEARLPSYRQLRADIGDHQSIQADLSTFSAHLQAAVRFLDELRTPALILFDEIGTGTEPAEGAALARSLLERLNAPGVTTVATTHQGALKAWAVTTAGAVSAAMEFDTERLAPTYRVLMGAAGVSAGLDIAVQLGLPQDVVQRARGYLGGDVEQTQAYLARLRELTLEWERRRDEIVDQGRELTRQREEMKEAAERDRRRIAGEAERRIDEAVATFRRRATRELDAIRDERARARVARRQRRVEDRLTAELAASTREIRMPSADDPGPLTETPRVGLRVHVRSLGREGEITRVLGERVEVLLGRMTFTVERADLGHASAPAETPQESGVRVPAVIRSRDGGSSTELMLVGKRVDEALAELDKWLDRAALAGHGEVRVVHGHGTGRLRSAVRGFLDRHPQVAGHRPGREGEGGDGATVVMLG